MIKTILVNIATLLTNKNELTFEDIFNESREPIKSHLEDLLFLLKKRGSYIRIRFVKMSLASQ